jgi:shikimate kinase
MTFRANLILVGFMGSGKSALGRFAAQRLGFQFLDTDALIVERAGMEISSLFEQQGEAHFRELETRTIESLMPLNRCVISTGGGAVLSEENRALLRSLGFVVLLTAREEIIFERVARNTKRPLLQTADPRGTIAQMLADRAPAYTAAAHWTLDTSDLSREQAGELLIARTREAFSWQ